MSEKTKQCTALKADGERCSRAARVGDLCTQHANGKPEVPLTEVSPAVQPVHPKKDARKKGGARVGTRGYQAEERDVKQQAFLEGYRHAGNVTAAALHAGVGRQTHYDWLDAYPAYVDEFAEAMEESRDRLEGEARRRAIQGVLQPVFQGGEHVGDIRKYSDMLLMCLLNAERPEKFRQRYEVSGTVKHQALHVHFEIPDNGRLREGFKHDGQRILAETITPSDNGPQRGS